MTRSELFTDPESNSPYYILKATKLFSNYREFNSQTLLEELKELRSRIEFNPRNLRSFGEILANDWLRESAFYALEKGALSRSILMHEFGMNQPRSTRVIQALSMCGVLNLSVALPRPRDKRGGPKVTIYQTPDALPEQIAVAVEYQSKLESPKYRQALIVAQTLLDDYPMISSKGEVRYIEILDIIKKLKITYSVPDIAQLTSKYLHEKGIKVWK